MCLSCAGRLFVGSWCCGELIVGLQIVRGDIERLQFRVAVRSTGWSGVLLGTLPRLRMNATKKRVGCCAQVLPDGTGNSAARRCQELESCAVWLPRFSTCEAASSKASFPVRLRQATTG